MIRTGGLLAVVGLTTVLNSGTSVLVSVVELASRPGSNEAPVLVMVVVVVLVVVLGVEVKAAARLLPAATDVDVVTMLPSPAVETPLALSVVGVTKELISNDFDVRATSLT